MFYVYYHIIINEGLYYKSFSTSQNMDIIFLVELREILLAVCGTIVALLAVVGLFLLYTR